MQHIAYYRKYRPKRFADVVGQEIVLTTLKNAIKNNKVTNAYIFSGPKGIGKTTIAKIFAKAINCTNSIDGDACEQCDNCKVINLEQTTDILEIDAASNNGIDDIRRIISNVKFLPIQLKKKVYIIDEAHMLTTQAWNALLKTIEECPEHVLFIFSSTELHKFPSTIISRCQCFNFSKFTKLQLETVIRNVVKNESISIEEDALNKLVALADGHARDVLSMLEQVSMLTNNNITSSSINEIFGLLDIESKISLINQISEGKLAEILVKVDEYCEKGINLEILVSDILNILLDKIVFFETKNTTLLKILNSTSINNLNLNTTQAFKILNTFEAQHNLFKNSNNMKFYFNKVVIELCSYFFPNIKKDETTEIKTTTIEYKKEDTPKSRIVINVPNITKSEKFVNLSNEQNPISGYSIQDVVNSVASNCSKEKKVEANILLSKIKDTNDEILGILTDAKSVLLASTNAVIVLYDSQLDAELLNKKINDKRFNNAIKSITNKPICFCGLTQNKFNEMMTLFIKNGKKDYKELKINIDDDIFDIFEKCF
jgi:DNA polymerase-3 subunit gamma/tau